MIKNLLLLASLLILTNACDTKKSGISGKVVSKATGTPLKNVLVNFIQCKEEGENCDELYIGQAYTNESGEFIIDKKTGSKSKSKWITVFNGSNKIAQLNGVGLNDQNIIVEAP